MPKLIGSESLAVASLFLDSKYLSVADFYPRGFAAAPPSIDVECEVAEQVLIAVKTFRELGAQIIYPYHLAYPREFLELEHPPLFLSCLGDLRVLSAPEKVAIVGSRELSSRCERWMEHELTRFLRANDNVVIISGGARGADQAAHLAAIRAQRPTVVFLPSGLNEVFPRDLASWIDPILKAGGLIISAYRAGDKIRNFRFEGRNRLIAALSQMVFVTEASRRSGSIMTARLAIELGRDLCVLPSFPGELVGQGTLDLMINGAEPIRDAEDLQMAMSRATNRTSRTCDPLMPGAAQTPGRCQSEETIREPHRDVRGQLAFSRSAFGDDVENVVRDN